MKSAIYSIYTAVACLFIAQLKKQINTYTEIVFVKTILLSILSLLFMKVSWAQFSPALGPPQAGPAAIPFRSIDFGFLSRLIKLGIEKSVSAINHKIDSTAVSTGIQAQLSFKIKSIHPEYVQTEQLHTPNNKYVRLRLWVEYTVSDISYHGVPYFSRKILQWITLSADCNDWQTTEGKTRFRYTAEKPYLDEAGFSEQALNFFLGNTLIQYVDSRLSQNLSNGMAAGELPIASTACNCLNFKKGTAPLYEDGYVGFYNMPVRKIEVAQLYSEPVLKLVSVKRIATAGELLMNTEDLQIEFWANYNKKLMRTAPIEENQTIVFKKDYSLNFDHPNKYGQLVITANITVLNQQMIMYSGFLHFEKDAKYGAGIQKLTIMRTIWRPASTGPDGRPVKPYATLMPAYELTFNLQYSKPKFKEETN
ncbi:MAG TPA: hypothetical protein PKC82_04155 [Chitinophagaceae bacterium]|nr:hypothetical protein [Chitinophagaceae bacterium]